MPLPKSASQILVTMSRGVIAPAHRCHARDRLDVAEHEGHLRDRRSRPWNGRCRVQGGDGGTPGREPRRRETMLRKGLAAMFVSLFVTAIPGAVFATPP